MIKTTKAQRIALKRVFDRGPIHFPRLGSCLPPRQMTYCEWRRLVQPTIGCDGAVAVFWCGMWLAIERDGHIHS